MEKNRSFSQLFCKQNFLFFCMLCFLVIPKSQAQSFDFISYGVEDGLSQSEARAVFQDSRGYLWIGTAGGGVCSFDGTKFHEYGEKDGLGGQIITSIAEDSTGKLWFGTTSGGVTIFDGQSFTQMDSRRGLDGNEIRCILAKKDTVWLGVDSGIFEFTEKNNLLRRIVSVSNLTSFSLDKKGVAWIGTGNGLFRFKNGKKDSIPFPVEIKAGNEIYCVKAGEHGLIYIGTFNGMFIYNSETKSFISNELTEALKEKQVRTIYIDKSHAIWVGTLNNLVVKYPDQGQMILYSKANGMLAEAVFEITSDNTNHIWFGTREQSLLKLRSESFSYFGNVYGMSTGTVFQILEDHAGDMWIGSNEDGLVRYDHKTSYSILNNGKPFIQPVALVEDAKKQIWVGHRNGLTCLVNGHPVKQLLQGIRVRSLYFDSKGLLWIGTWGNGLYCLDGEHMENFNQKNGSLPGDFVHSLAEDQNGNIWIGTGAGLVKYNRRTFITYGTKEGLCNSYVGSIAVDPSGNIWFHTDLCIMRFDGNTFISYSKNEGLATNTFYLLKSDTLGQIWIGGNKGIDRLRVDALGRVLSVKNYSRNEGFRGIECNSRAVCLARDGCLWFGTVKGVIRFNPVKDVTEDFIPPIHLSSISLFMEKTDWAYSGAKENGWFHLPDLLELNYEQNYLTFTYEAINLENPESTRYKFMLVGFDSTWQKVTAAKQFTYTNLSPGKYIFKVLASNGNGNWNPIPAISCEITILKPPPPIWRTWWFIVLSILIIAAVLVVFVKYRTRRIVEHRKLLEKEVKLRTLEISRQNEEKTVLLKEIHHRVKNNLQIISSLLNLQAEGITDKKVLSLFEDCRHRVNSMALIHQKMYQSNNLVNIDIRNYIDELIRSLIDAYETKKSIHLHTEIEDHLFRIDTIVPLGLILNEIISNSLKYAFEGKEEGELIVSLHKIDLNKFVLEVSDNGGGIPADVNFEKAETLGLQLIQMLSGQINGKVLMEQNGGTKYRIEFEEEVKDRF